MFQCKTMLGAIGVLAIICAIALTSQALATPLAPQDKGEASACETAFERGGFYVQFSREQQRSQRMSADGTQPELILVDGILMELPRVVIREQIRNGTFIPVYPGTTIPIGEEDWGHNLPCWANPNCP